MISVIICSININNFFQIKASIHSTIGVPFEIIKIDNFEGKYSIAEAYNMGAEKAIFEFLVFVHEDVIFHTDEWGKVLIENFNNLENPGILGIAGSSYTPIFPSDWWVPDNSKLFYHYISNIKFGNRGSGVLNLLNNDFPKAVYALDGVFLAVKKFVFFKFRFDESIKGFHGYDTSISLRVSEFYTNYFVPVISIEHFSEGNYNFEFIDSLIKVNKTVLNYLVFRIKRPVNLNLEVKSFKKFLEVLFMSDASYFYKLHQSFSFLILGLFVLRKLSLIKIFLIQLKKKK